jgi:uncharacterized protein YdaU (DUF1376 family)
MSNRAWMPLHIADYQQDTGHLTAAEHGAYLMLIMRYWQDGGLPSDERLIARYSRLTPAEWADSRDILFALFSDGWKHKRIDAELSKADEIIGKRKAAAEARYNKPPASAVHVDIKSTDTGASPSTDNHSSLRSEVRAPGKPTPRQQLETVLDPEHAEAVIEHRQRLRKPLTERAAKMMAIDLAKFPEPNVAADQMIKKGWLSIDVGWKDAQPRGSPRPVNDLISSMISQMDQADAVSSAQIERYPTAPRRLSGNVSG